MRIQKSERGFFKRFRRAFSGASVGVFEKSSEISRSASRVRGVATFAFVAAALAFWAAAFPANVRAEAGDELLSAGLEEHRAGKYQEAVATFDRFIASYPNSKSRNKAELFDGHSHLALGAFVDPTETAAARRHFQYIIDQGKNAEYYKEATFHNAHSYFDMRQYAEAKPLFEAFLAQYPKDAYVQYVYYYLGVCESQTGSYDAAVAYFDKNLTEYPDSPLRWTCRLEKIATIGQSGNFAEAEKQLTQLAADPKLPSDVAGQVVIQRALLQIVQQKYDVAIQILEDFIARYRDDSAMAEVIQDAYLYEAYAYFAKKEFERALLVVETMERAASTIAPETALLKIKLLVNLNRVDEAESLLNKLAASSYGVETPDAIVSYRALISLARGDWDATIRALVDLLKARRSPSQPNAVVFDYFSAAASKGAKNLLAPHDFVESCGVLTIAYASRYAAKKNESDNLAQSAVFQATSDYAASRDDPGLDLILAAIDVRRRAALTTQPGSTSGSVSVAVPSTGSTNAGPGGFLNPTDSKDYKDPGFLGSATDRRPGASGTGGNELFGGAANNGTGTPAQTTGSNYGPDGRPTTPGANGTASDNAASTPTTPKAAREALEKATAYYVNQEYDRANETLLAATTSSETFWTDCPAEAARIYLLRASVLFSLDKRYEAQLTCQELLKNAPFSQEATVANFYLGYGADYFGRRDDAIKYLRQAVNAKTESPFTDVALYYLGMNEWERRDVEGAERTFARLYRDYPKSAYWSHAVWATAKIESDARNDVVAEELVNEALRKKPDASIVDYLLFLKGEIALRAKDYRKAQTAFEMIVEQYPDGIWYSKAKNRLASIPARFLTPTSSADVANGSQAPKPSSVPSRRTLPNRTGDAASADSTGRRDSAAFEPPQNEANGGSSDAGVRSESDRFRRPNAPTGVPSVPGVGARPTRSGETSTPPTSAATKKPRVYELSFADELVRF